MTGKRPWTKEEINQLQTNAGKFSARELATAFNRTIDSVERGFVRYGGVPRRTRPRGQDVIWTDQQLVLLRTNAATTPPSRLAPQLGLPLSAVLTKLRILGLPYCKAKRPWTQQDVIELMDLAEKHGHKEIAKITGRHIGSVHTKMTALGLRAFQGSYSMRGAERATGYHYHQLLRAKNALNQSWTKRKWKNRGRFVISEEQLMELCDYLKTETWKGRKAA